jgi:DNA-binding XRE family transcriptional regulator
MSGVPINITGERFDRLVALRLHHMTDKRGAYWTCQCDCGNETVASLRDLRDGGAKSCGCLWREAMRDIARNKATTKLTWVDVRDIQRAYRTQMMTRVELARKYGVSHQTISNALKAQVPEHPESQAR